MMATTPRIQVTLNGQPVPCPDGATIPELLEEQGMRPDRVIVEFNGQAQTRAESAATRLSNGDRLEVVRIVAGG